MHFLDSSSDKVIAYERTLGDERIVVQCNFSGEEQPALAVEGAEVLIGNYDDPLAGGVLHPWEGVAHIWR